MFLPIRNALGTVLAIGLLGLGIGWGYERWMGMDITVSAENEALTTNENRVPPALSRAGEPGEATRTAPIAIPLADAKRRWALLIGVTKYDHLETKDQLDGPANDVVLMRQTLRDLYGFLPEQIVSLTEAEQKPESRPTRANIVREYERLIKKVGEGDQVVILMAGHGSRQPVPDPNDPNNPEIDGLDEIFLPADVSRWDSNKKTLPGAIIDDEIGAWLTALTNKKAYVWAIFDCCHSGNMTRGLETPRQIVEKDLIPIAVLDEAKKLAAARAKQPENPKPPIAVPAETSRYLVALYACRAHEVTVESRQGPDAKSYGLLSYTTVGELTRAAAAGQRLTYRDLLHRIQARYLGRTGWAPTPGLEASEPDRAVLATDKIERPSIVIREIAGKHRADCGDLHGMTAGSILAVFDTQKQGQKAEPLGHVRIVDVQPFDSVVEPCSFAGMAAPKELPKTAYGKPVFLDYALQGFRVAVVADKERSAEVVQVMKAAEEIAKTRKGLIQLASDVKEADVVIRLNKTGQYLEVKTRDGNPFTIDVKPTDPQFVKLLAENLEKIHRASNLIRVASQFESNGVVGFEPAVKIDVEIAIVRKGAVRPEVVKWPAESPILHEDDKVQMKITNVSKTARVDASILIVDPEYKITAFYPLRGGQEPKALGPGESATTISAKVVGPFGLEKVIVIAMAATSPQVDFTLLAQSGLKAREGFAQSPVALLLENAMDRTGTHRGLTAEASDLHAMKVIGWRCEEAAKRSK